VGSVLVLNINISFFSADGACSVYARALEVVEDAPLLHGWRRRLWVFCGQVAKATGGVINL
jgi:hypothetical protein